MKTLIQKSLFIALVSTASTFSYAMTCSSILGPTKTKTAAESSANFLKAEDMVKNNNTDDAIKFLEEKLAIAKRDRNFSTIGSDAVFFLAELYYRNRETESEIRVLQVLVKEYSSEHNPKFISNAYGRLAFAYERLAEQSNNLETLKRSVESRKAQLVLRPGNYIALKRLVDDYLKLNEKAEALIQLELIYQVALKEKYALDKVLPEGNNFAKALVRILREKAKIQLSFGNLDEALKTLTVLFEKHKDHTWALTRITNIKIWERKYEEAIGFAKGNLRVTKNKSIVAKLQLIKAQIGFKHWHDAQVGAVKYAKEMREIGKDELALKFDAFVLMARNEHDIDSMLNNSGFKGLNDGSEYDEEQRDEEHFDYSGYDPNSDGYEDY